MAANKKLTPADQLAAKIDEYGVLDAEIAALDPRIKRHAALKKEFRALAIEREADPEKPFSLAGNQYLVVLGAQSKERSFTCITSLFKAIGKVSFLKHCTFTLKAAEALLPNVEFTQLVKEERTGSRTIQVMELGGMQQW